MKTFALLSQVLFIFAFTSCDMNKTSHENGDVVEISLASQDRNGVAAFASGCFWCTEHIFESLPGVDSAVSGYAGGTVPNPTYELVNTETTGHAETVLVYYDNKKITYEELTNVFFLSHDPTTPNRQGPDVGSSYRSILFYSNDQEKKIAEKALEKFKTSFSNPIVTEIKPLTKFYRAEGYHQDYIEHNPREPYVVKVSIPRFEKFKEAYKGKLRHGY